MKFRKDLRDHLAYIRRSAFFALAMAAKLCKGVKQLMFLPVTWLVHVASYEETCL